MREADGEPEAIIRFEDTALLLAASLPVTGRGARYWTTLEPTDGQEAMFVLKTIGSERGPVTVGILRSRHEELLATLSTVDHLLRSPASLAFVLEAAPVESLSRAVGGDCRVCGGELAKLDERNISADVLRNVTAS